jgi:hypothetical protein
LRGAQVVEQVLRDLVGGQQLVLGEQAEQDPVTVDDAPVHGKGIGAVRGCGWTRRNSLEDSGPGHLNRHERPTEKEIPSV